MTPNDFEGGIPGPGPEYTEGGFGDVEGAFAVEQY